MILFSIIVTVRVRRLKLYKSEFTRELGSIPLDALEIANLEILNSVHVEVLAGTLSPDDARTKRFGMLLTQYGIESVPDKLGSIAEHYRASYQLSRRAVPGAKRLLRLLRDRGLKTAIVTNNLVEEQMDKLRYCELLELIDSITISEEAGYAKPDIRIFQTALDRLECKPEEAVVIGDSWENDILGARAVGIRGIWYNCYTIDIPDKNVPEIRSFEDSNAVLRLLFPD